jgi:hypothetical protein
MTITEFLLARIAEVEMFANGIHEVTFSPQWVTRQGGEVLLTSLGLDVNALLLGECEAKRRIVAERETFGRVAAERDDQPLPQVLTSAGIVTGLDRAVRALALPYADHPDYREEWRP